MRDLLSALAIAIVIEGLLPFVSPGKWREAVTQLINMNDSKIRRIGLTMMGLGLLTLFLVRKCLHP